MSCEDEDQDVQTITYANLTDRIRPLMHPKHIYVFCRS